MEPNRLPGDCSAGGQGVRPTRHGDGGEAGAAIVLTAGDLHLTGRSWRGSRDDAQAHVE